MYPLKNKTFQIVVHGCRTNQYEGEAIASLLENAGATYAESNPEIVVFVTCTITAVADRKCRKQIRKLRREYPNAVIVVCGCYVQKMDEAEKQRLEADIYVGNRRKFLIPQLLAEKFSEKKRAGHHRHFIRPARRFLMGRPHIGQTAPSHKGVPQGAGRL
ncbi:hypothetical protein LJC40_01085 [Synergistaceae bacterium OttesenSCG-928-D05]|nr:hypothetical protein [Synergistaceae bacterium OttesenSCG-928-D05]